MTILTKKLLPMALFVSTMTASINVFAAETQSGTISFTGLIYSSTCTIDINNTGSDGNVNMGRFPTSAFTSTGTEVGGKAGNGELTIKLIDCPTQGKVTLKLSGNTDSSSDYILALDNPNDAKTAKNIGIRLYDEDDLNSAYKINFSKDYNIKTAENPTSLELSFIARYISTASTVEAGRADATLNYTLTYQ